MTAPMPATTPDPYERLVHLEAAIERGERQFVETGRALAEIQRTNLFSLRGVGTFAAYVTERFDMSRSRAYQLIYAAWVSTVVDIANEAQARALAPLGQDTDAIREVWAYVGDPPTAARVQGAVNAYLGRHREQRAAAVEAGAALTPMAWAELRDTSREAELALLSIGTPPVRRDYGDMPDRALQIATRLAWLTSAMTGWDVEVAVDRHEEAAA